MKSGIIETSSAVNRLFLWRRSASTPACTLLFSQVSERQPLICFLGDQTKAGRDHECVKVAADESLQQQNQQNQKENDKPLKYFNQVS